MTAFSKERIHLFKDALNSSKVTVNKCKIFLISKKYCSFKSRMTLDIKVFHP